MKSLVFQRLFCLYSPRSDGVTRSGGAWGREAGFWMRVCNSIKNYLWSSWKSELDIPKILSRLHPRCWVKRFMNLNATEPSKDVFEVLAIEIKLKNMLYVFAGLQSLQGISRNDFHTSLDFFRDSRSGWAIFRKNFSRKSCFAGFGVSYGPQSI